MKTLFIALASALAIGCVQGSLSDTVSAQKTLQFDQVLPAQLSGLVQCSSANAPMTHQSTTFDESDFLKQMQKLGSLSMSVNENSLSGNLSAYVHARLTIHNDNQPPQAFAETDIAPDTNGKLQVKVVMDQGTLFNMLSNGEVIVDTYLSACAPAQPETIVYTFGADANLSVNKSL